jgi:hypothetical protein
MRFPGDLVQTVTNIVLSPGFRRIHVSLANIMLIAAGMIVLPVVATASTVSFSVSAKTGPAPAILASEFSSFVQWTTTILVESNPALRNATGYDALIDYSIFLGPLFGMCTYTPPTTGANCSGLIEYEVSSARLGGMGLDVALGGIISEFSDNVEQLGQTSGSLEASAGKYEITAMAYTVLNGPVAGEVVTPDASGETTGNFTIVDGDVSVLPEPGTIVLFLLAAFGWLAKWGYTASRRLYQSRARQQAVCQATAQ